MTTGRPPKASVIIATVDRPAYLRGAIASVLAGTFQDFEIIVTDDAGSEENRRVAESFGDPRIRYRGNEKRLGSSGNHREALKIATGEFVGFLNDDDECEPQCLDRLAAALRSHPEAVIAFGDHFVMNEAGAIDASATEEAVRRWKRDRLRPGMHQPFLEMALIDQSIPMVSALIRRSAIDWSDIPLEVDSLFDFWATYLACRTGGGAWYCPEKLARYRVHHSNDHIVGGERTIKSGVFVYSRILQDDRLRPIRPQLRRRVGVAKMTYALYLIINGQAAEARALLWTPLAGGAPFRASVALAVSFLPGSLAASAVRRLRTRATRASPQR